MEQMLSPLAELCLRIFLLIGILFAITEIIWIIHQIWQDAREDYRDFDRYIEAEIMTALETIWEYDVRTSFPWQAEENLEENKNNKLKLQRRDKCLPKKKM